jgi:hypothetical protein
MNHHYIPQFYLRPWLGPDHKLQEFRRGYGGRIQSGRYGTKSTGYAVDLYTLAGTTPETRQNVEKYFMGLVDNSAVRARDMMLEDEIPRDQSTRHSWARFLMSLVLRNPEEISKFKERFGADLMTPDAELQARYENQKSPDDPPTLEEWLQQSDPTYSERSAIVAMTRLVENQNVLRLIRGMEWRVIDTSGFTRRLMTSDRPIAMTNGLGRYDGHCALPLSPTKLFLACTYVDFANGVCSTRTGKLIRSMNDAVIGQAKKYVYSLDRSSLAEVRRLMGKREPPSFIRGVPEDNLTSRTHNSL